MKKIVVVEDEENLRLRGNCGREHCCPIDSKFSKKTGDGLCKKGDGDG
jgi:hypothetical protein